jgi:hypothetical protein
MPLPKRPHVASPEQVRITRDGDYATIEYADGQIATTRLKMGADRLAVMTDTDVLAFWNEHIEANQAFRDSYNYVATEIPVGKPQVEYFEEADQWVARGGVLRCQIVTDAAVPVDLDEPVVSIDGRDFTTAEFIKLLGGHGGWGMRIVFVPDDELHERPKIRVREPAARKKARVARSRRGL